MTQIDPAADLAAIFDGTDFTRTPCTVAQGSISDAVDQAFVLSSRDVKDEGLDLEERVAVIVATDLALTPRPGATVTFTGDSNAWSVTGVQRRALGAHWLLTMRRRKANS